MAVWITVGRRDLAGNPSCYGAPMWRWILLGLVLLMIGIGVVEAIVSPEPPVKRCISSVDGPGTATPFDCSGATP